MAATGTTSDRLGWNDARSLASRFLSTDDSVEEILDETPLHLSQEDIETAKANLPDDGTDRVNDLARTLLEWQDRQHPAVDIDDLPESIDGWNDARSVASAMKTLVQSDAESRFEDLRTHIATSTPTFTDAQSTWESVETEDGGEALNEYARWVLNWEVEESGSSGAQDAEEDSESSPYDAFEPETRAEACANALLKTFETHAGGYGEIFSEYGSEFDLPSLGRANVVVVNAKGETHEERVEDIAHWLTDELDENTRAGTYRPSGMH